MPTGVYDGVKVITLRAGSETPLFMVPGLECNPHELQAVVDQLTGPQAVVALAPLLHEGCGKRIERIERMAELMLNAVRDIAPSGPYRLAGYSFGGLVALELAQQLSAGGWEVESLFLVDAVYDELLWNWKVQLTSLARRTAWQLGRISQLPPRDAVAEFRTRGARLVRRALRMSSYHELAIQPEGSGDAADIANRSRQALAEYQPTSYSGRAILLVSAADRQFGFDLAAIWSPIIASLRIQRVIGDHLGMMREPASTAAVASVIDHELAVRRGDWPGLRPTPGFSRPLILSTMRWFSAARLAHALIEAGFVVSACRPPGHHLGLVDSLAVDTRLSRIRRLDSLARAIERAKPDIILPDDERAVDLMLRLYAKIRSNDPRTAAVIAHSLGSIEDWPSITRRAGLAEQARLLNLPAPETMVVDSADALASWAQGHPGSFVLKTDASWGGRGVLVVHDATFQARAWSAISRPPSLPRALKRMIFDLDPHSLWLRFRHMRPAVNVQEFCSGREAIVTVACVDGKVLSLVCLEVVQVAEKYGPATVVKIIEHPGMAETARQLVCRFRLSGFCGFDFMVSGQGEAALIELNPRVTPTAYLLVEGEHLRKRTIALFPFDLFRVQWDGRTSSGTLDVPRRAPRLVLAGNQEAARRRRLVTRMIDHLKRVRPAS